MTRIWNPKRPRLSDWREPVMDCRWPSVFDERDTAERTWPLDVEWPSTRVKLPDFIWPTVFSDLAAKQEIAEELIRRFRGARLIDVRSHSRRPPRPPDFWEKNPYKVIWVDHWIDIDVPRSSYVTWIDEHNRKCHKFLGIERYGDTAFEDPSKSDNHEFVARDIFHVARTPGVGIYVAEQELDGLDFFRLRQSPFSIRCNDAVADFIQGKGYSNIEFLEEGETFSAN